jgi:hypothetical protein
MIVRPRLQHPDLTRILSLLLLARPLLEPRFHLGPRSLVPDVDGGYHARLAGYREGEAGQLKEGPGNVQAKNKMTIEVEVSVI